MPDAPNELFCSGRRIRPEKAHVVIGRPPQSPTRPNPLMGWALGPVLRPTDGAWARGKGLLRFGGSPTGPKQTFQKAVVTVPSP